MRPNIPKSTESDDVVGPPAPTWAWKATATATLLVFVALLIFEANRGGDLDTNCGSALFPNVVSEELTGKCAGALLPPRVVGVALCAASGTLAVSAVRASRRMAGGSAAWRRDVCVVALVNAIALSSWVLLRVIPISYEGS